jgi:hypothetical protein
MNKKSRIPRIVLLLLIVTALTSGCGAIMQVINPATATPYPTNTPYPTATPYPEKIAGMATSDIWKVKIISAERSLKFEDWYFAEGTGGEYILVTVEFTNMSSKTAQHYPKAVELLYANNPTYPGEALRANVYKTEYGDYYNFTENAPLITYVNPGQTKIETFGWEIVADGHKDFMLLFPGVDLIDFTVDN